MNELELQQAQAEEDMANAEAEYQAMCQAQAEYEAQQDAQARYEYEHNWPQY